MPVSAQDEKPTGTGPVMVASFGFGGQSFIADRWGPITVQVTTGDRALSGMILVRFDQDDTQKAQIAVPFAATPNKTTQVPVVACLPSLCSSVRFTMMDEQGRVVRDLEYTRVMTERTAQLPPLVEGGRGLIVCMGRCSLPDSVRVWNTLINARTSASFATGPRALSKADLEYGWMSAVTAVVGPEDLPWSWMAYDGVAAMVVNPASVGLEGRTAEPRTVEAVHAWVRSGGRLVVMAEGPGEFWRVWVPEEAREFVTRDAGAEGALPAEVSEAVRGAARTARARLEEANEEDRAVLRSEGPMPGPATSAPRRALRISGAAAKAGWKLRWGLDEGTGLLAEGPVGYGHVTVLGMDPARAPEALSGRAAGEVWKSALESGLQDWVKDAAMRGRVNAYGYGVDPASRALNTGIERVGDVPVIGDGVFYIIALAVLLLVAMLGPVDYFLLKRMQAGHRSWLTALAWVGLSCVVAYVAPRVIRTAPTQLNRIRVVDRMASALPGSSAPTYQAGLTGIYAARGGTARFLEPDMASWWRGTSVGYGSMGSGSGMALVPTMQAAAGGEAGSRRGNPVQELPVSMWTFRVMADQSCPEGEWAAVSGVVRRAEDGYRVMVTGLPEGAIVSEATLRVRDKWYGLTGVPVPDEPMKPAQPGRVQLPRADQRPVVEPIRPVGTLEKGAWTGEFKDAFTAGVPDKAWAGPAENAGQANYFFRGWYGGQILDLRPGPMLSLPGADRRGQGVDRRVASGAYAAVCVNLAQSESDVKLNWSAKQNSTTVLRLLVPLEGEAP